MKKLRGENVKKKNKVLLLLSIFVFISFIAINDKINYVTATNHTNNTNISRPDLIISDLTWNPSYPVIGQPVTYSWKVRNIGYASAGASITRFWTNNPQPGPGTTSFLNAIAIPVGGYYLQQRSLTYTGLPGVYQVSLRADYYNIVLESNEGNNELIKNVNFGGVSYNTTCNMTTYPSIGVGPFTSLIQAVFYNWPPDGQPGSSRQAIVKCHEQDPGLIVNLSVGILAERSCTYPQVQYPTFFIPSARGLGIGSTGNCSASVRDNPPSGNQTTCTDTDGGINYRVRGSTYNYTHKFQDLCQSTTIIKEYYCLGNAPVYTQYNCANINSRCDLGSCVLITTNNTPNDTKQSGFFRSPKSSKMAIPNNFCKDSDGGLRYDVFGITTNRTGSFKDTCQPNTDNQVLEEYYCSNLDLLKRVIRCNDYGYLRCYSGRCRTEGFVAPEEATRSRFFLWKIFDIFKVRPTGNAVRETGTPNYLFGWIIVAGMLFLGVTYLNRRNSSIIKSSNRGTNSRKRSATRRR